MNTIYGYEQFLSHNRYRLEARLMLGHIYRGAFKDRQTEQIDVVLSPPRGWREECNPNEQAGQKADISPACICIQRDKSTSVQFKPPFIISHELVSGLIVSCFHCCHYFDEFGGGGGWGLVVLKPRMRTKEDLFFNVRSATLSDCLQILISFLNLKLK